MHEGKVKLQNKTAAESYYAHTGWSFPLLVQQAVPLQVDKIMAD